MTLPGVARLELPILQELVATGGGEDVRFLYARLVAYFPQLHGRAGELTEGGGRHWKRQVQRAGRELEVRRQLQRERGFWQITQ